TGRGNQGSETDLTYPANIWPTNHLPDFEMNVDSLYNKMESISTMLLSACSTYLGHHDSWLPEMAREGNTIMRIIHYPPLDESTPEGAVRSAAHEDINLITLLMTATAAGLQVMDHDGTWIDVEGNHEQIIVDSGDMIQNLTNGLFKSTTHRVVNPGDPTQRRFSMPMFVHPRNEIDLTPLEEFVSQTGGTVMYPSIKAGEYLHQRLVEIGLASN
ncbi:MAG: isopenicillin N synthase family dioxygenase, partial [Candidatus Poseidoniaceae archaeon]